MSLFGDNSAFYLDSANDHRGNRGELDKLDPYSPIPSRPMTPEHFAAVPWDVLERWHASLVDEAERVTQDGRSRQAADSTQATLQMLADELYSYLRG